MKPREPMPFSPPKTFRPMNRNFHGFFRTFPPYSLTLVSFPPDALRLSPLTRSETNFTFQIQGQPKTRYALQSSTNLVNWVSISRNTLNNAVQNVTKMILSIPPRRFGERCGFRNRSLS